MTKDTLSLRNKRFQKVIGARINGARERDRRGFSFEDDNRGGHLTLAYSLKIDTLESFIVLFFFSPQKLVNLFPLKEVKPSTDRKIIQFVMVTGLSGVQFGL